MSNYGKIKGVCLVSTKDYEAEASRIEELETGFAVPKGFSTDDNVRKSDCLKSDSHVLVHNGCVMLATFEENED